jgi:hypothetical protein
MGKIQLVFLSGKPAENGEGVWIAKARKGAKGAKKAFFRAFAIQSVWVQERTCYTINPTN